MAHLGVDGSSPGTPSTLRSSLAHAPACQQPNRMVSRATSGPASSNPQSPHTLHRIPPPPTHNCHSHRVPQPPPKSQCQPNPQPHHHYRLTHPPTPTYPPNPPTSTHAFTHPSAHNPPTAHPLASLHTHIEVGLKGRLQRLQLLGQLRVLHVDVQRALQPLVARVHHLLRQALQRLVHVLRPSRAEAQSVVGGGAVGSMGGLQHSAA